MHPNSIESLRRDERRKVLAALVAPLFFTRGLYAEELARTPSMTEGPFYPDKMPLDRDNDLIVINDSITPAVGEITHLTGRILSPAGEPLRNATIEIWQCDANAVYLHTNDSRRKTDIQDKNFQGYGKFETAASGEYRFRTIKPVPYPGRPSPHIHMKITQGDKELLTTQLMIRGHEGNAKDGIFRQVGGPDRQALIQADWAPKPETKLPEWNVKFDLIVGLTPDESRPERRPPRPDGPPGDRPPRGERPPGERPPRRDS